MCLVLLCPWLALAAPAATHLRPGDAVPDLVLVDQDGRSCRVSDFKGRALAVTFIFTRCPLQDYCPRLSLRFHEAQQALAKERQDAKGKPWHFLTLSFDPQHDTPEALKTYARIQGAELATWTFATAGNDVVPAWASRFGLTVGFKNGLIDHNLRTVVIDATGHLQHIFEGNQWTANDLIWEMKKAMR